MGTEKPKILLVDDHVDTTDLLGMFLERKGFQVAAADSVAAALEVFGGQHFDLVISDLRLPDGSGYDLIQKIRAQGPIAAVALSGSNSPEDFARSKDAGFDAHLVKPIGGDRLVETIKQLLH